MKKIISSKTTPFLLGAIARLGHENAKSETIPEVS
jgi:hypothetical protein